MFVVKKAPRSHIAQKPLAILEDNDNLYIHCQSGDHSLIAVSLIKRQGLHNLRHLAGGWDAIVQEKRIETEKEKNALN